MSEEEKDQMKDKPIEVKRAYNSPKHSKETWLKVRVEYESGLWTSLKELSKKYGIHYQTLFSRLKLEKWDVKRQELLEKAQTKVENHSLRELDLVQTYLSNTFKRALRLERIADASLSQASLTNDGIPLVDLDQVDILTRSELRIHELAKSALRIIPVSQVEHTGGRDFGASFVEAIARLRSDPKAPKLGAEDLKRVLEADIVD